MRTIEQLQKENAALVATVEALKSSLRGAITAFRQYELDVDDYPTMQHKEMMQSLENTISTTPQQHLAEIRAEAGRAGFVEGARQEAENEIGWFGNDIQKCANQYADSIRKGEVK